MSPTKFKPLLAATVMSAIYMAGVPTTSQASVQSHSLDTQQHVNAVRGGVVDYVVPEARQGKIRSHRYIIQLDKQPAAMKFPAAQSGDSRAAQIEQYVNQLENEQANLVNSIASTLGRSIETIEQYQRAYNGVAVWLDADEVAAVESQANVKRVIRDKDYVLNTDSGPELIGANELWEGHGAADPDIIFQDSFEGAMPQGNGVVVGIIDSGINTDHPSFAATDVEGYTHTNPLGEDTYLGVCDPDNSDQYIASYTCNAKLIGLFDFVSGLEGSGTNIVGGEDENGHGSHTASTAAGNMLDSAEVSGFAGISISGVAPRANIVAYDACYTNTLGQGLCPGVSTLASVEQVIEDGIVDVINYSIGGGSQPWDDPVSLAFLSATQAGVFVSASAGNGGPGAGTLGHLEPWTASVAATTHDRQITGELSIGSSPAFQDIVYSPGNGPTVATSINADMRYAGDVDAGNVDGCNAWPNGDEFDGEIALVDIFTCPFADKVDNAAAAGAVAVVVISNAETRFQMGGLGATTIPAMTIARSTGLAAITELSGGTLPSEILAPTLNYNGQADVVAGFSSRGPSPLEYNKPDVAAPGVSILAAVSDSDIGTGTPAEFGTISGTSMAAPHNAGSAALLMERNPSWSVAEIKSALMMKAVSAGVTKEDGVTPADPFDIGAGRIQVDEAAKATLVLDETASNFMAQNPATGGDLTTLNVASLTDYECEGTCTFTRTFRSVADTSISYEAMLTGVSGTVTPPNFTVPANGFQTVTVEVDATTLPAGQSSFGELILAYDDSSLNPIGAIASGGPIPDDGYPGDLFCADIEVAGVPYPLANPLIIDLGLEHTYSGDMVLTLENPNGDVLGLMDGAGSFNDTEAGSILRFNDAAVASATSYAGCSAGDTCEFSPAPGSLPTPPSTLADLTATDVNGTWEICAGDTFAADTGSLNTAELILYDAGTPIVSKLPVVIVAKALTPEIELTPSSFSFSMPTNSSDSDNLIIQNTVDGTADLDWDLQTSGSNGVIESYIFQQLNNGDLNGIVSDFYVADGSGVFSADNFNLAAATDIDFFTFNGFMSNGGVFEANIDSFTVEVFADNAGEPDGNPDTVSLFELTIPIDSPNFGYTATSGFGDYLLEFNVLGELGSALNLAAGEYWVSAYANFSGSDRWNWSSGVRDGGDAYKSKIIDPDNYFGGGFTTWTDIETLTGEPALAGLDFSLAVSGTCAPLPGWLSMSSTGNTGIAVGAFDDIDLTVDSTGLAAGTYEADVCISSNDLDEPLTVVPVTLEVTP